MLYVSGSENMEWILTFRKGENGMNKVQENLTVIVWVFRNSGGWEETVPEVGKLVKDK